MRSTADFYTDFESWQNVMFSGQKAPDRLQLVIQTTYKLPRGLIGLWWMGFVAFCNGLSPFRPSFMRSTADFYTDFESGLNVMFSGQKAPDRRQYVIQTTYKPHRGLK
jgi:hypothetical protein